MPIIFNNIYPERYASVVKNYSFTILIDSHIESEIVIKILINIDTLREYLTDLGESNIKIKIIFANSVIPEQLKGFDLECINSDVDFSSDETLIALAKSKSVDILWLESTKSIDDNEGYYFNIVDSEELLSQLEVFLYGHDIPWSFARPVWYISWSDFYAGCDTYLSKLNQKYISFIDHPNLDKSTIEEMRSLLLNRLMFLVHTKYKLLFYIQQRRFAKRNSLENQSFYCELSYYVNYYYVLIWGSFDQLAVICNRAYKINHTPKIEISFNNRKFKSKLKLKSKAVWDIISDKEFRDWYKKIGEIRHAAAHKPMIVLASLVEEPTSRMSEEELEKVIEKRPDLINMKNFLTDEQFNAIKDMVRNNLRLNEYSLISDEVSVFEGTNKKSIFSPLKNVEFDFNHTYPMIIRIIDIILSETLVNKS